MINHNCGIQDTGVDGQGVIMSSSDRFQVSNFLWKRVLISASYAGDASLKCHLYTTWLNHSLFDGTNTYAASDNDYHNPWACRISGWDDKVKREWRGKEGECGCWVWRQGRPFCVFACSLIDTSKMQFAWWPIYILSSFHTVAHFMRMSLTVLVSWFFLSLCCLVVVASLAGSIMPSTTLVLWYILLQIKL